MSSILSKPEPEPLSATETDPVSAGTTPITHHYTWRSRQLWVVIGLMTLIAATAQFIGEWAIPVGVVTITVLPMVWGLLASGFISSQRWKPFPLDLQATASTIMSTAVLFLIARLAFTMGPNITLLVDAGPALLLQEAGHLFGTLALALPLAVILKMGPATVGATFSIDREGSFAMVSERYGADSPQYRGMLSMYAFGTLFGAIVITIVASVLSALDIFDPRALAMGSGVGSGSMMAAAAGAVAAAHPELADEVLALAGTSNLITSVLGVYVGMYVALPLADRFYKLLTRHQQRTAAAVVPAPPSDPTTTPAPTVSIPVWTILILVVLGGFLVNAVVARSADLNLDWHNLAGFGVLALLVAAGIGLSRLLHGKLGAMFIVVTLGVLLSTPWSPVQQQLLGLVDGIDFLATCSLVLCAAGLSLGKDLPLLKTIGWKIVPVGLVSITSSYLLATIVAELALTIAN